MKYHVFGIGNALVDKEFEVTDDFLAAQGIQKGESPFPVIRPGVFLE